MKSKHLPVIAMYLLLVCPIGGFALPANVATTDLVIQPNKIFDPNTLSLDSVAMYEKTFNYDWDQPEAIAIDQKKLQEVEQFIKTTSPQSLQTLPAADKEAYGKILLKVGTYYTHVAHQLDLGIARLQQAENYLKARPDKAWAFNHIAYAYEIKYADLREDKARNKANYYSDKVINQLYAKSNNKEVAFAYCIKGLIENDDKNFGNAERYFQKAIKIYEALPSGKDDQYAKTRIRLAGVILSMNDRDQEAIKMLEQLKQYWVQKGNVNENPYAARNSLWLGQAYLKIGNPKEALDEINNAINVYQKVYGRNSTLLIKAYHLLSTAYKTLGDQKLADTYEEKATTLNKSATS